MRSPTVLMSACHLDRAAAIERATEARPWSRSVLAGELRRRDRSYLVCHDPAGVVVGFGGVALLADEAHVMRLAVEPSARRRGHGGRLLRGLLDVAVARGAAGVTLEVRASNVGAQRLYRGNGFEPAGVRPGYYPNGEDALILWWRPDEAGGPAAGLAPHDAVPTGG